jgi:hypothetical protein
MNAHLQVLAAVLLLIGLVACQGSSSDGTPTDVSSGTGPGDAPYEAGIPDEEGGNDGAIDISPDSDTATVPSGPPYGDSDADAGVTGAVTHAPIYITVNAHGHNYGIPRIAYQGFVSDDNLDGWFELKRQRYQSHRAAIMWLAEEAERVNARMSFQLNGEYARDSFTIMANAEGDDTEHLHDLIARGHAMSSHFHPFVLSDSDEFWENVSGRKMTTALMDQLWADHLESIENALGFGIIRADPAHDRNTEQLMAHYNSLLRRYDLSVENVGESFSRTRWSHRPWNTFRRNILTGLTEDLNGSMVAVHSYPQVGREVPQGRHIVISTVPQLKRRFIDITMQWLYSQATGQAPRIWTFGIMTHPDSNARYQDEMLEMLEWLAEMTTIESPFGGPIAEFVTDTELVGLHEAWEDEYPGASSFSFDLEAYEAGEDVPYPYDLEGMVLATHDGEFTSFLDTWENDDVMAVALVHRNVQRSAPQSNGAVTTTIGDLGEALYVLWTPGDPVVIDMSAEVGPILFRCDGVTGAVEAIDSGAVMVTSVPQVVSITDTYFED